MRKWMCGEEDKERREVRKGGVSVVLLAHYCVCVCDIVFVLGLLAA